MDLRKKFRSENLLGRRSALSAREQGARSTAKRDRFPEAERRPLQVLEAYIAA